MARKKKPTAAPARPGMVQLRHPETGGVAWFGEHTVAHFRKNGWMPVTDSQPVPAGDTGSPSPGDSQDPKE